MVISGFDKLTLLDYKGKVACIIFTGGCNFRCPYCHNGEIVTKPGENIVLAEDIYKYLERRKNLLDGVVISGGEPLIHGDVVQLVADIKDMGYSVKIDTNGTFPETLNELIDKKLVDYVAMDIKGAPEKYGIITGVKNIEEIVSRVRKSIEIIMNAGIDYEFRTTFVKGLHDETDCEAIGKLIKGSKIHYIQNYRESERILARVTGSENHEMSSFSDGDLLEFKIIIEKYVEHVEIR